MRVRTWNTALAGGRKCGVSFEPTVPKSGIVEVSRGTGRELQTVSGLPGKYIGGMNKLGIAVTLRSLGKHTHLLTIAFLKTTGL